MSDSLQPHGLYSPWNSPGQNTGGGSLSLLQGIFPTQGSNPGLLHCGHSLLAEPQGKPKYANLLLKTGMKIFLYQKRYISSITVILIEIISLSFLWQLTLLELKSRFQQQVLTDVHISKPLSFVLRYAKLLRCVSL